ncbi:hypothetical protein MNBD_GAMMA21-1770 [hydrothermal vent metagenome]|uniref:TIGR04219 family outer membrane beta-barrel protein n=1 Tax=hydrothermal vent metagenome TaxID=652676 RepID=A0A3B0ZND9_9ZZZZ
MKIYISLILLSVASLSNADALGVRVSGGLWSYEASGDIRDSATATDTFNLKDDFGIKDTEEFQGFVYFEHPVPIIPNVRVGITSLKLTGNGNTVGTKLWNGTSILGDTNIISDIDLSHTEIGLYYEIIDTGFDLDLGVNVKLFDGTVSLSDGATVNASSTFSETIPMLYGSIGIPLVAGFSIGGDISYINYNSDSFSDYFVNVRWVSSFLLGIEAGYRSFTIDYADGDQFADVKIEGPYVNARLVF